jgi:hypothetical protein
MIKSLIALSAVNILFIGNVLAQEPAKPVTEVNVIPPSPTVASFNKFIETPVGHYTGVPNISIPVFNLQLHQIELPISISYHASGLKVDEHASWVGAGWSLNAGGSINRTVKGLPDEYSGGGKKGLFYSQRFYNNGTLDSEAMNDCYIPPGIVILSPNTPYTVSDSLSQGLLDIEPDLFVYNFPGGSGKFYFNENRSIVKVAADDCLIDAYPFKNSIPYFATPIDYSWSVFGPDGVKYVFSSAERNASISACGSISPYGSGAITQQNAWLLDSIKIGSEWITFYYESESLNYGNKTSETAKFRIFGTGVQTGTSTCMSTNTVTAKRLVRIESSNGFIIYFDATVNRLDLSGSKRLEKIRITKHGQTIKEWEFKYSYYNSNRKLKLTGIDPIGSNGVDRLNGYIFDYESGNIPAQGSNDQDYWGFYNGMGNSSLIPTYKDANHHVNINSTVNRNPVLASTKIGVLKKITYPTRGYSEYTYELNEHYDPQAVVTYKFQAVTTVNEGSNTVTQNFTVGQNCSATLIFDGLPGTFYEKSELRVWNGSSYVAVGLASTLGNRKVLPAGSYQLYATTGGANQKFVTIEYEQVEAKNVNVGGLRIKSIVLRDLAAEKVIRKYFQYVIGSTTNSSGVLFTPAKMGYHESTHHSGICGYLVPSVYINLTDNIKLPLATYSGSHVAYSEVREFDLDTDPVGTITPSMKKNGEIVYSFVNEKDNTLISYPYISQADLSFKNGQKISELFYRFDNNVLYKSKELKYFYQTLSETSFVEGANFKSSISRDCYACVLSDFKTSPYEIRTKWFYLERTEEIQYDLAGTPTLTKSVQYFYDIVSPIAHHQVLSTEQQNSRGEVAQNVYTRVTGKPALISETQEFVNTVKVKGEKIAYQGKLPTSYWIWDPTQLSELGYHLKFTNTFGTGDNLIYKTDYPSTGSGTESTTSFIWGYNNTHLIGKVVNAQPSRVFHTSFEDGTTSSIPNVNAKTGRQFKSTGQFNFQTDGNFTPSVTSDLVMSYWYYTNNQWNFSGWVPFANLISQGSYLDEIRVIPTGAQINTFTYWNGVGLESQTDHNNKSSFYEYDTFQRLILIRDDQGKIMQHMRYNYYDSD